MWIKWEWRSGLDTALHPALGQGEAGQGSIRERTAVCLLWNLVSLGWSTSTTAVQNALQPSLTHVVGPVSVRNLKLLECIWLVLSVVPTHHLLCKQGSSDNFYTREDSCPGKGILCRQNGASQATHGGQLPWEQMALGSMYKYHGRQWQNRQRCLSQRVSCKGTAVLQLSTVSSQPCLSERVL